MKKTWIVGWLILMLAVAGCTSNPGAQVPGLDREGVVVEFACPVLEELVRNEIGKPDGDILSEDMWDLIYLRIGRAEVTSLEGLEYAKNLINLSIERMVIPSLSPVSSLPSLEQLRIAYAEIQEPVTFAYPEVFTRISLIDTPVEDIHFMNKMKNMEELTVTRVGIEDISALTDMPKLKSLFLSDNQISDISPLAGKPLLEKLDLQNNQVTDISVLEEMSQLEYLCLSYNPVTNLQPIEHLNRLQELRIYKHHDEKHLVIDQAELLARKGIDVYFHR